MGEDDENNVNMYNSQREIEDAKYIHQVTMHETLKKYVVEHYTTQFFFLFFGYLPFKYSF